MSKNVLLLKAACDNDAKAIEFHLNQGANIEAKNRYDMTAVMLAAKNGHLSAVQTLVERGAWSS